jgi:hypothetical protein
MSLTTPHLVLYQAGRREGPKTSLKTSFAITEVAENFFEELKARVPD